MKKTALSVLVLTLCALYSITPLLIQHEFIRGGWDLSTHISKASQVSMGIREGILYPRWLSLSNGGYGSPTMDFYSPLFYWITGVINLIVPSLIVSLKVSTFMGFLLSGIAMFIFLRNFCNHAGSVAGGMAYQLFPYHIFDLYIRQTLAETFAFFWLPLIFHFAYKAVTKDKVYYWIGLAFSYAGLVVTHLVSAYIFTFVMAAFALYLCVEKKSAKLLMRFITACFFGLCLSAIYFMPMLFERRFVHIEWLEEGPWNYTRSFLSMTVNNPSPFYVQLKQIVLFHTFFVIVPLMLVYYKRRRYGDIFNVDQLVFFSSVFVFSLFMSTYYSLPIWKVVPGLPTILFPWRWLIVSTFATSILIGLAFNNLSFADIKRNRFIRLSMAVFHAVLLANFCLASLYIITAAPMQKKDMERILSESEDLIEYRPIWLSQKTKEFSKERWETPVIFKKGDGRVDIVSWKSHSRLFKVNASTASMLKISTFHYPGWTALVNGREIPIGIERDSGAMLLNIPPGNNEVLLEFRDTPLRRGAKWISIISIFVAFASLLVARLRL